MPWERRTLSAWRVCEHDVITPWMRSAIDRPLDCDCETPRLIFMPSWSRSQVHGVGRWSTYCPRSYNAVHNFNTGRASMIVKHRYFCMPPTVSQITEYTAERSCQSENLISIVRLCCRIEQGQVNVGCFSIALVFIFFILCIIWAVRVFICFLANDNSFLNKLAFEKSRPTSWNCPRWNS